jgi:hypothetical protein
MYTQVVYEENTATILKQILTTILLIVLPLRIFVLSVPLATHLEALRLLTKLPINSIYLYPSLMKSSPWFQLHKSFQTRLYIYFQRPCIDHEISRGLKGKKVKLSL